MLGHEHERVQRTFSRQTVSQLSRDRDQEREVVDLRNVNERADLGWNGRSAKLSPKRFEAIVVPQADDLAVQKVKYSDAVSAKCLTCA